VLRRENAGLNSWIAFHQQPHSDSDRPRSNMAPIHGYVGPGPLLRARDS
jgi:hypothetical protein